MMLELEASSFAADLAESLEKDPIIAEALQRQVSLKDYSKQVEEELAVVEAESVQDYVEQSSRVARLHEQMRECDEGLEAMQETLGAFGRQLGGLAEEVRRVEEASTAMTVKLRNRKAAERGLAGYLRRLVLPSDAEEVVETREVLGEVFASYAAVVDARIDELGREPRDTRRFATPSETAAGEEARRRLEGLKSRIVRRARDALLACIGELRTLAVSTRFGPGSTAPPPERAARVARREKLALYGGPAMSFLEKRAMPIATEVRSAYVDAASKALQALLKAYNDELAKHDLLLANKHDLVAVEESAVRSTVTTRVSLAKRGDAFSIGDRDAVLRAFDEPAIEASAARRDKVKLPVEALFRSSLKRLRDAAACERNVARAVFGDAVGEDVFQAVFQKPAAATVDHLEARAKDSHDLVGLALVAKLCGLGREEARASKCPLDSFYDACDKIVWPRVEAIVDANIDSARRANPAKLGGLGGVSPHYVTRRFAELAAASCFILDDALKTRVTETLRDEVLTLLARLASHEFSDDKPKDRVVFLANNYDQVILVLDQRLRDPTPLRRFFDHLLARQRDAYVDATLDENLGGLVAFVKKTELDFARKKDGRPPDLDQHHVEKLIRDFAAAWEPLLAKINNDVLASFSNFVNGTQVLKQVFTQLLVYYTRFQDIIRKAWRRPPPFAKDLVSTATILVEIKKYTRTFS
ncbi:hypothetical protein CTAYLR_009110 [Chrysophaeum taylorii]|uniref:Uncharacterized protein n=1 Tax=Chrysophaeum taylorii TaxID=2483200 RepID=A0AAD7XPQ3_9STRA|nr:hypothetical protein CTAYLR_009110 [Chrysophaeum taylorii]